ncbi:serine hydrolase domain-containing protein [Tateyamaria omphalii]|uniref:serine hydrolase domain-containing protein n=1 Tax=Tateyamaria omphalii TaxID=299262 RepID=UPI0016769DE4|nr:serine hydrolase domain-containing protein [Tateyamaria omphalii]
MQALFRLILCAASIALPALASGDETTPAYKHRNLEAAFADWLAAQDASGSMASGVFQADYGWIVDAYDGAADKSAELASVSKSVTAVCALHLVDQGRLDWSDSLRDFVNPAPDVTVGELVTHTSGLAPDVTQFAMFGWLGQAGAEHSHFSTQVLDLVNARPEQTATVGEYFYNNENYALLALVIEHVTDMSYFDACSDVLDLPASIQPGAVTGMFQPWGGLVSDAEGYLSFLQTHFGPGSRVARDPFDLPHVALGGGAYYGMGMVFRPYQDSFNFWHFGALCFPGRLNIGSFAVIWEGKVSVIALYDQCVDGDAMGGLDAALSAAVYGKRP